jgi:hypothetical protein
MENSQKYSGKGVIHFSYQTVSFFILIPVLIIFVLSIFSVIYFGSILKLNQLNISGNMGMTIVLYTSFISPFLIYVSKKYKWLYFEFWSVIYLGIFIIYLYNGSLEYNEHPEFNLIFPFIYYELMYENSQLRKLVGLNSKYNLKKFFKKYLDK